MNHRRRHPKRSRDKIEGEGVSGVATRILRHAGGLCRAWFWKLVDELRTCRACENRVRPWDDVCAHCGAGYPVFIGCSHAVIVTALACEAVLVWLCFV